MVIKQWREQWLLLQEAWQARYHQLQPREQRMLLFAALILPLILFWFGLWLPLQDRHDQLMQTLKTSQQQADEAVMLAKHLQQSDRQRTPEVATGSLLSRIDKLIAARHLRQTVKQMKPQPGMDGKQRLRLSFKPLTYAKASRFLLAVEQQGLPIEQMKMERQESGYVRLQLLIGPLP